jgi:assimilatory nitrate reductase catalytic subunit
MMWHDFAYGMLTADAKLAEHLEQHTYQAAAIVDGEVDGVVCVGPADRPLSLDFGALSVHDDGGAAVPEMSALSVTETEPAVCACFGISEGCIRDALASRQASSVTEIGQVTRAGTNCGSCLPELKRMVAQEQAKLRTKDPVT